MIVPVTIGADIELGNSLTGSAAGRSNLEAASRVLAEVGRIPPLRTFGTPAMRGSLAGEWGRVWMGNGGCLYCDLGHIEHAVAETSRARHHAAAVHAQLRIVRAALRRAQARLPEGEGLFVNTHVTDGSLETSWGAHLNLLVSRRQWDDLLSRKPHQLALLASFLAAALPVFGQGALLPVGEAVHFLTCARACHIGSLVTLSTTEPFNRGLVNSRDEAHADPALSRLHLIAFDSNLQPAAILMRTGLTQLVLAALASGWFDARLLLDDPVAAVRAWSLGFDPRAGRFDPLPARLPAGGTIGLLDWHRRLVAELRRLVESDRIPERVVPEGGAILDLWSETLEDLAAFDLHRLASRLDWALKWLILSQVRPAPDSLGDPRLRLLDQLYGHVDDRVGLFWKFWREGLVDRVIDDREIARWMFSGDPETRSGLRGELVSRLWPWIVAMDWSTIEVMGNGRRWGRSRWCRIDLPDPSAPSGTAIQALRERFPDDEDLLEHLVETAASRPSACVDGTRLGEDLPVRMPAGSPQDRSRPRTPWRCGDGNGNQPPTR